MQQKENVLVRCICSKIEISGDNFCGGWATYILGKLGGNASLPPVHVANSPTIAQHNPRLRHSHTFSTIFDNRYKLVYPHSVTGSILYNVMGVCKPCGSNEFHPFRS